MRALALVAALLCNALVPAAASDLNLIRDPAVLKATFLDRTLYARHKSGAKAIEYYSPDGRAALMEQQCLHAGQWWTDRLSAPFGSIPAGTAIICSRYPTIPPTNSANCFAIGGASGAERFYPIDGPVEHVGTPSAFVDRWLEGNSEPLPLDQDTCPSV